MPAKTPFDAIVKKLRAHALAYPETREDFPWGERAWKVKKKVFVFNYSDAKSFSISAKLPVTFTEMLRLPFVQSTGYGLGKAGWVTARFEKKDLKKIPVDLFVKWIDESYRAVAPKGVLKTLDAEAGSLSRVVTQRKEKPRRRG